MFFRHKKGAERVFLRQSPFKIVVFDWNGTLLDDTWAVLAAFNAAFRRYGFRAIDLATMQRHYDPPYEKFLARVGIPQEKIPLVKDGIVDAFHATYEPLSHGSPWRLGAVDLLSKIQRAGPVPVILSNHFVSSIRCHLRRLGGEGFFEQDAILANGGRDDQLSGTRKIVRLVRYMEDKKIKPEEALIVGDTPEEAEIAQKLGMTSALLTGGCAAPERLQKAHYVIDELPQFARIVWPRLDAPRPA